MMVTCSICSRDFDCAAEHSEDAAAGEWLAQEVWNDAGQLCPVCLEIRTKLVMMYCHEYNT